MSWPRAAPRRAIPILTYHQITVAPPRGAAFRGLCVAPDAFARQMGLLHRLGYQGLSMSGLMPYLRGERTGRVVGITFDDGYLNNLTHALPVLQRLGYSATCYMVSDRAGGTNAWDAPLGVAQVPLMDRQALRAWVAGGLEIGAHTRSHPHLPELTTEQARREIRGSRDDLEALVEAPVRHFCYPYGDYRPDHANLVAAAGFDTATTTERGRVRGGDSLLALPRVPVLRSTSLPLLGIKLLSAYEDRRRAPASQDHGRT